MKYKISIVFGTRPEIIKLAPLIKELKKRSAVQLQTVFTNQHKDLAKPILNEFGIEPDETLPIERTFGDLNELASQIFTQLRYLASRDHRPDLLIVHGDTASSYYASLFGYQFGIPVAHVEAGLRSHNLNSPFPEEFYRQSISKMARMHFVPSIIEKNALMDEGVHKNVFIVGNTVFDAITLQIPKGELKKRNQVLVYLNRRETKHKRGIAIELLKNLAAQKKNLNFLFLRHPSYELNMEVPENVFILDPMGYTNFLREIKRSQLFITDSGGAQEEVGYLGTPTLIFRDQSERSNGLKEGIVKIVGSDPINLINEASLALSIQHDIEAFSLSNASPSCLIANELESYLDGGSHENTGHRGAS